MFTRISHPDADTLVYSFSLIMLALVFAASLLATVGGFLALQRTHFRKLSLVAAIMGLFGVFLIGPTMAADRVTVTRTDITQKTGLWFSPNSKGFDFRGVERVVITRVRAPGSERSEKHWFIHRKKYVEEINPGDLWDSNSDTIIPWLQQCGVKFADE